ncbi:MAG: hypothetical protein ACP5OO_01680 [Chloroflexia bacterium]
MNPQLLQGLLGAVLCLAGFSLYWGGLRVVGMFLGGTVGLLIGLIVAYLTHLERSWALLVAIAAALVGMAVGWSILRTLHAVLVFLIGAGLGFLLTQQVLAPDYDGIWTASWMPWATAVAGGILMGLCFRYVIILVTTAFGAYLIYQATGRLWVAVLALVVGLAWQIGLFHRLGVSKRVRMDWR